jgi:membrane protein YfhO
VATVSARLASGRAFDLPLRADVDAVRADAQGGGARRRAALRLPGRYYLDAVRIERPPGPGRLLLGRLEIFDVLTQRTTPASLASAYVSDAGRLREVASIPGLRLFEVPGMQMARVVGKLRVMPSEEAVVRALDLLPQIGLDPRREALVSAEQASGVVLARDARSSRADLAYSEAGRLDVRAEGPGLLVVSEAWDEGWDARVDGRPAAVHRVNLAELGVVLEPGTHHVALRYRTRGFFAGLALAAVGAAALAAAALRGGVWRESGGHATVPLPRTMGRER